MSSQTLKHIKQVENGLRSTFVIYGQAEKFNIEDRMQYYQIPGVSIAVVNKGKIEWAKGYGVKEFAKIDPVTSGTIFLAGSISKPITALGALLLANQGRVDLDTDVNEYLKRWKIPENEYTKKEKVTLRRLLSHNAGLTVHGFPGYKQGQSIPTTVEILNGAKPLVNTDPVVVDVEPGSIVRYSGGGTTIVQLLIEDVTGEPFAQWMQDNVLSKLEMYDSTFNQQLTPQQRNSAASGHNTGNVVVPGGWHIYPEMAAAGLWTTPSDLAKVLIVIQNSFQGKDTKFFSQAVTREMLTPQNGSFGLGPELSDGKNGLTFSHGGTDEGFKASWYGIADEGSGIVIMTNSITSGAFIHEVMASTADTYGWNHLQAVEKKLIDPTTEKYSEYAGEYGDKYPIKFIYNKLDRKLFVRFNPELKPIELYQDGTTSFFSKDGLSIVFTLDHNSKKAISVVVSYFDNPKLTTYKKK